MAKKTPESVVVGLYSFPKSGNTWLRAIIAAAVGIPDEPGNLHKYMTDSHYGKIMKDPWSFEGKDWYFYKSHHKNLLVEHKEETIKTDKILYIYRHPLDVFLSYLNFVSMNVSPDLGKRLGYEFETVEDLSEGEMEELFKLWCGQVTLFPQNKVFGSVFENINNFKKLQKKGEDVHIVRYEDLQSDFSKTAKGMFSFLGFKDVDTDAIFADADQRTKQNGKFFWKRTSKNYENYLSEDQIQAFKLLHKKDMKNLGYLD